MSVVKFTPLEPPIIDPRNERELIELAMDTVYTRSKGQLNDFSAHSPVRALIEGQAFAGAELLYYLNQALDAFAIRFLQIVGVQRKLGSAAIVMVRFELSSSQFQSYAIPSGYTVYAGTSKISYTLTHNVVIPPGFIYAEGLCLCDQIGTIGNLPALAINQLSQPLTYLAKCWNPEPAVGGTDEETEADVYTRAFQALRRRGLISLSDYENELISVLGSGSVCKAIANLGQDGITYRPNTVHLFALNPDYSILTDAQKLANQDYFAKKAPATVDVFISNIHLELIGIWVYAKLQPNVNPFVVATGIREELDNYLLPGNLPLGASILMNEIEYHVHLVDGIQSVDGCQIGKEWRLPGNGNYPLPYPYSVGRLSFLAINLSDGINSYNYTFGQGDPD